MRLADIINLIGAEATGIPKKEVPISVPSIIPITTTSTTSEIIRPRSLYELAERLGYLEPFAGLPEFLREAISKKKSEFELASKKILEKLASKHPETAKVKSSTELSTLLKKVKPKPTIPLKYRSALEKVFKLAQKYPMTAEQAKALVEILSSAYTKTIKKGWGPFKKKKEITIRPHPKVLERELPKVLTPPEPLVEKARTELTERARELAEKVPVKEIEIEKMKLPEPIWLETYRGETLREQALKSAQRYNEAMRTFRLSIQDIINQLTSPETARAIVLGLNADFATDALMEIYRYSGGTLNIAPTLTMLREGKTRIENYLNQISDLFSNLLNIRVDLISELEGVI